MRNSHCKVVMRLCAIAFWHFLCNCLFGLRSLRSTPEDSSVPLFLDTLNKHASGLYIFMGSVFGKLTSGSDQPAPADVQLPLVSLNCSSLVRAAQLPLGTAACNVYLQQIRPLASVQGCHLSPISVKWVCVSNCHIIDVCSCLKCSQGLQPSAVSPRFEQPGGEAGCARWF